jgi:uncharacterized protein
MSMPLYDATVLTFLQTIGAMEGVLVRGFDHCRDNALDPQELVDTRIYPDMLPFRFQVVSIASHSLGAIEAVRSGTFTPPPTPELDYTGLQKLLSETRDSLSKISAEEIESLATRDVQFSFRDRAIPFTGANFLLSFSTPNFFFHSSMAYAILRFKGVPLGKRDFMGQLRIKR